MGRPLRRLATLTALALMLAVTYYLVRLAPFTRYFSEDSAILTCLQTLCCQSENFNYK
jgi:hypothetical protein